MCNHQLRTSAESVQVPFVALVYPAQKHSGSADSAQGNLGHKERQFALSLHNPTRPCLVRLPRWTSSIQTAQ